MWRMKLLTFTLGDLLTLEYPALLTAEEESVRIIAITNMDAFLTVKILS